MTTKVTVHVQADAHNAVVVTQSSLGETIVNPGEAIEIHVHGGNTFSVVEGEAVAKAEGDTETAGEEAKADDAGETVEGDTKAE